MAAHPRALFFGSGAVALPALERLLESGLVSIEAVVTAPPPTTVRCSVNGGATPGTSRPLRDFLASAVAIDQVDDAPNPLTPRVGGAAVEDDTLFPLDESTEVAFRFEDDSGNVDSTSVVVQTINLPPSVTITSPPDGYEFQVDETIPLTARL